MGIPPIKNFLLNMVKNGKNINTKPEKNKTYLRVDLSIPH